MNKIKIIFVVIFISLVTVYSETIMQPIDMDLIGNDYVKIAITYDLIFLTNSYEKTRLSFSVYDYYTNAQGTFYIVGTKTPRINQKNGVYLDSSKWLVYEINKKNSLLEIRELTNTLIGDINYWGNVTNFIKSVKDSTKMEPLDWHGKNNVNYINEAYPISNNEKIQYNIPVNDTNRILIIENKEMQTLYFGLFNGKEIKSIIPYIGKQRVLVKLYGNSPATYFYDKESGSLFFPGSLAPNNYPGGDYIFKFNVTNFTTEVFYVKRNVFDYKVNQYEYLHQELYAQYRLPNSDYLLICERGVGLVLKKIGPENSNVTLSKEFGETQKSEQLHKEAFALYKQHKDTEAVLKYEEALKIAETSQLYYDYANSLSNLKDRLEDSKKAYLRSMELGYERRELIYYNIACVESRLGNVEMAYKYLQVALDKGYSAYSQVEKDGDLVNLRKDPGWKDWWTKAKKK